MSLKVPAQKWNPPFCQADSKVASRSSAETSRAYRGSATMSQKLELFMLRARNSAG